MQSLFDSLVDQIAEEFEPIRDKIARLPLPEQVEALNRLRAMLHEVSPFKDEPVDCVQWVPVEQVQGNDYNPNSVAPPEMKLLVRSIDQDGYTQPVVGWRVNGHVEVVDGFHRARVGKESQAVRRRVKGYLPVALIKSSRQDRRDRVAATIRHNRARGVHAVLPMTDIVADLVRQGWTDTEIAKELGMDADEVLRFKQNTGIAELFKDSEYSAAWE
jgi:ParB-like chromosome segregation protein Spo0J